MTRHPERSTSRCFNFHGHDRIARWDRRFVTGHPFPILANVMLVLVLCLIGGCSSSEGIRSYTVRKEPPSDRMLAAIIPRGEEVWFFKLTGPNAAASAQKEGFEELIKSITFTEGANAEPQWKLPLGWSQGPGNAMRFATLTAEANGESMECTVSKLPRTEQSLDDFLLANINRWRGQMRQPPIDATELPQQTTSVELADGKLQATIINIAGQLASSGMGSAPFAKGGAGPVSGGRDRPGSASTPKVSFQAPPSWSPGELEISRGSILVRRDAAFEVKEGDRRVEITVTKLPGAGADAILSNVNRWRGQVGLDEVSAESLEKDKQQIQFANASADYVQFTGPEQAILGVIADRNGLIWFVKLQGDKELANRERKNFEDFVKSIRLE
jgi:hypothetical protein